MKDVFITKFRLTLMKGQTDVYRRGTLNIFYNVLLMIVLICCIKVNKPRYLTSDGISVTFNINGTFDIVAESFISSSLFIFKSNREFLCFGCRLKSFLTLLFFNFVVIILW